MPETTRRDIAAALTFLEAGMRAHAEGRLDEAMAAIDAALRIEPDFPEALGFAGFILQDRGHALGAMKFYDRALAVRPDNAQIWFNRGILLSEAHRAADALASFERACALQPRRADYHSNRAAALHDLGRLAEAVDACGQALALDATQSKAALNLGNALMRLGRYREARTAYERAIEIRPDYALAFCGLGIVAKELGFFDEAMRAFDKALELAPESEEALSNRGCLQLLLGDFAQGWEGYEYRWSRGARPFPISSARFDCASPASLEGQRILVVNDHGLGDTIQFFRYVILLVRAGATVTFSGPSKMRRLLASSGVSVVWREESDLSGSFDAMLPISSLPRAFGTRRETIPASTPYIFAEPERVARWRERLKGEGTRIGLCWQGNVDFRVDPRRSFAPEAFLPFTALEGVRLFSLQKGFDRGRLPEALACRLENLTEALDTGTDAFIDTAAMIAELDLVVTCDTSIAHLAGAMGRPVWLALRHVAEWRWLTERRDSPWYPTMRLFRCREGDDWQALAGEMAAEVRARRPVDKW
ncbi:tetratricopeptide repeat protein [Rhodoblastus sp.]|uniref:tetratricopeptide repeat protein n=1 Tax=Rhodoblastus sp. TaxID=1962975 RepID=UPI0026100D75|nr:tetratricopeptide repeat protein [Rhodoblastus sp.]